MAAINFFEEDVSYKIPNKKLLRQKMAYVVDNEGFVLVSINLIMCSDEHLLLINKQYLNHDYYTDIITFDLSSKENNIEGDLFISLDRLKINSTTNKCSLWSELQRVAIHGILHLVGYDDKTPEDYLLMKQKEDHYLEFS